MAAWEDAPLVKSESEKKPSWESAPLVKQTSQPATEDDSYSSEEYESPSKDAQGRQLSPAAARMERLARKANAAGGGDLLKGIGEAALTAGSGLLSSAAGGVAGIGSVAKSLISGEGFDEAAKKGAETVKRVQQAGTYQPRSDFGGLLTDVSGELGKAPSKVAGELSKEAVASVGGGLKSQAAAESIGEAAPSLIPAAAGLKGALKSGLAESPMLAPNQRQQAAAAAQKEGYAIPPSQARPTLLNKLLEGMSGKIKTAQGASEKNQVVTNNIVKEDLGIPIESPISKEALKGVREKAGTKYEELKQYPEPFKTTKEFHSSIDSIGSVTERMAEKFPELFSDKKVQDLKSALKKDSFEPGVAIDLTKYLREKANDLLSPTASGESKALGRAYRDADKALEAMIEKNLEDSKESHLLAGFKAARQTIAKTYSVEKALNVAGDVDANILASQLKRDKPLSGGLKRAAEFAGNFPKSAKTPSQVGSHLPTDALDYLAAIASGIGSGNLGGLAAVAARPLARKTILSKPYQQSMASASKPMRDNANRAAMSLKAGSPAATSPLLDDEDK